MRFRKRFCSSPEDRQPLDISSQPFIRLTVLASCEVHTEQAQPLYAPWHRQISPLLKPESGSPGRVAAKQFVRTFTDLANDHTVVSGQLGDVVNRHADRICNGLVLEIHHAG